MCDSGKLVKISESVPDSPGVYILKNPEGKFLYIGKAKSLNKRVKQHFTGKHENPRHESLIAETFEIETIITENESEALILEATLIKKHAPPYNILMRDDKSYPFIAISSSHEFPFIRFFRGNKRKGFKYYGPYSDSSGLKEALRELRRAFPFRTCPNQNPGRKGNSPCLDYQLGLCTAPCIGKVSPSEYGKSISNVISFLDGRQKEVVAGIEEKMWHFASSDEFERAAEARDRMASLKSVLSRMSMHIQDNSNRDIFAIKSDSLRASVALLYIRGGWVMGKRDFIIEKALSESDIEILEIFLTDYYGNTTDFPERIHSNVKIEAEDIKAIENLIFKEKGVRARIATSHPNAVKPVIRIAEDNATASLIEHNQKVRNDLERTSLAAGELADRLGLKAPPYRIESYDVSQFQSMEPFASMVVFEGGFPARSKYRVFGIREITCQNDIEMIAQALSRRFKYLKSDKSTSDRSFSSAPDLIVIDGGPAQLNAAVKTSKENGFDSLEIISLAKRFEEVFTKKQSGPLIIPRGNPALDLLIHLRDEAHRFALLHHRKKRQKNAVKSGLENIKGIGPKRSRELLRYFESYKAISEATVEELEEMLPRNAAIEVYDYFNR